MKAYSQAIRERVLRAVDHGYPSERVSRWTMSRAIKRLGWTRKKSRSGPRSVTRKNGLRGERARANFRPKRWYLLMKAVPTLR